MKFYEEDYYDREYDKRTNPLLIFKGLGLILGAFFAPAIVVAVLIFIVFMRFLKWKPTVTIFPLAIAFIILYMFSATPLQNISNISLGTLKEDWKTLALSYLYISMMVGIVFGYIYILYKAIDLKRYPEYVHIAGWAYGFKYAPTPLDKIRKRRNIKALKNGELFDYEKAPIGVLDEPVVNDDLEGTLDMKNANRASIVYRYYTEAMAHTLITGKTGSGKALHVDTPILTKEKGWTTVGNVEIGDTLYNESGNHTKVENIFRPMTEDHYELTFENGEVIKACGDHLWNIGDVEDGNTISTRQLAENFSYHKPYEINHSIDGRRIQHKIQRIKRIQDNPEDYVCFTVDSPSKLFLVTKSLIPTHNTVTMLSLIQNDILAGNPVCVIDFKKSPDLIYFLSKWAKENGREFYHFVSGKPGTYKNPYKDDQATYDPLSTGGATAKADMILNLRTWDSASEVFKKRTQDVLQSLFFLLERTPRQAVPEIEWDNGGLAQFVSALDLGNFKKMIEHMAKDMQAGRLSPGDVRRYNTLVELYKELSSKTKSDLKAQIIELLSIARTLIVSNYGDWLAKGASEYHIDLMKIATSDDAPVVLFSFNQQEEPEFAKYIGSIVMSDLSRVSALKNAKGDTTHFGVYIDEFQTLDPGTVKDNLEKARSSKMYITLSLQSIDQIVSAVESGDGEAMANAIIDTCANFIFHDGSGYDTAEKMSKIIGKSDRYIYRTTSNERPGILSRLVSIDKAMVSKDIQKDWLVPPSEFQSLESPVSSNGYKATAYVVNKSSDDTRFKRSGGALARKVHVVVADETAKGVPDDFKKEIFVSAVDNVNFEDIQATVMQDYIDYDIFAPPGDVPPEDDWVIEDNVDESEINENETYFQEQISAEERNFMNKNAFAGMESMPTLPSVDKDESKKKAQTSNVRNEIPKSKRISDIDNRSKSEKPTQQQKSQLDLFNQLRSKKKGSEKVEPKKVESKKKEESEEFKLPNLD